MKIKIELEPEEVVALGKKYDRPVSISHAQRGLMAAVRRAQLKEDLLKQEILSKALDLARMFLDWGNQ